MDLHSRSVVMSCSASESTNGEIQPGAAVKLNQYKREGCKSISPDATQV